MDADRHDRRRRRSYRATLLYLQSRCVASTARGNNAARRRSGCSDAVRGARTSSLESVPAPGFREYGHATGRPALYQHAQCGLAYGRLAAIAWWHTAPDALLRDWRLVSQEGILDLGTTKAYGMGRV